MESVKGNHMGTAKKLITEMKRDIFLNIKTKPAGEIYKFLFISFPLEEIKDNSHYKSALQAIEKIIDFVNSHDEDTDFKCLVSEIQSYLGTLSTLVEKYEKETFPMSDKMSGREVLQYLMESHDLGQNDLADEIGGQSVVSFVLNGKRELNIKQIRALSKRFHISPIAFMKS